MRPTKSSLVVAALTAGVLLLGACGGSSKSTSAPTTTPGTAAGSGSGEGAAGTKAQPTVPPGHVAKVATNAPSASAQMICKEAVKDINDVLGIPAKVSTPTWKDHVYSCDYNYPNGAKMTLSVKEMSSPEETTAYYDSLAQKLGKSGDLQGLGQGAFSTPNGGVVTRKDYKVMTVDVSHLPANFGSPPDTRGNDAINVAFTVMGCWTGA